MARILTISLAAIVLSYVVADSETSVYVPFIDPQPISADLVGIDTAQGRTTWALHQGAKTGTWADQPDNLPGTATLVEGVDFASLTYALADPSVGGTMGGVCTIEGGDAVCVEVQNGGGVSTTFTETESVVPFGLQIAATAVPAGSGPGASVTPAPSGSGASESGSPSAPGGANSGSTPSGSAPASTQSPSSSTRTSVSSISALAGLFLAYHFL